MKIVENRKARVFGVTMYFAVCYECHAWVQSSIGQFCWTTVARRNRVSCAHRKMHTHG